MASTKHWRAQGPSRSWLTVGAQLMNLSLQFLGRPLGQAQSVNHELQSLYSMAPNSFPVSQLPLKQSFTPPCLPRMYGRGRDGLAFETLVSRSVLANVGFHRLLWQVGTDLPISGCRSP